MRTTTDILKSAKKAVGEMLGLTEKQKNDILEEMAKSLVLHTQDILEENKKDIESARGTISQVMIDRLLLNSERIAAMAQGIRDIISLPDPVGELPYNIERPQGLLIQKVAVPIGVVAIIYESRPNVTSDAAALCLKSGNVCVLRSGKEAFRSAFAIVKALKAGIVNAGFSEDIIGLVEDTTRISATELMTADDYVDLLIPRGGKGLIKACTENASVPCIETGTGICHIYVDKSANIKMALDIIENAKASRPSVCNAAEVCLVHRDVAENFLPQLKDRLKNNRYGHPVELKGDSAVLDIIEATPAQVEDFDTEFLDYILAVKIVDSIEAAAAHIAEHSTHHSDCIIAEDEGAVSFFKTSTDSAAVYVNASTRFTDGGEFGLGCEMGISTQKLHARGPMGLRELTTYKYIITGNGNIR